MKLKTSVFIFAFLNLCFVYGQHKVWEVNLNNILYEVGWIEQTNDGLILASGAKGLMALDNNTGASIWHKKDIKSADKNSFLNIDGLPIFYLEYTPLLDKKRGMLINSSNGAILYDSKEDGYRIQNFNLIPEQEMILFEMSKDKTSYLMKFSLRDWKKDWIIPIGAKKKGWLNALLGSFSFIDHPPQFDRYNNMILGVADRIYVIHPKTGAIVWQYKAENEIKSLIYSSINDHLYLGVKKSNKLKIFDPQTGHDISPKKLKLRGYMIDLVEDKEGNLILVETEGFNIIDPKTNTFKWKKSFKIDDLHEVIPYGNDFIAIGKNKAKSAVVKVDALGEKLWSTGVMGYAYYLKPTDKGILYITTERSNILDYQRGKELWKKDIKFRTIPAVTYDHKEKKVVLFESEKMYKFDLGSGEIQLIGQDIKLQEVAKDTPLQAEYIEDEGYFIYTDQHLSLITPTGALKYTSYYSPPTSSNVLNVAGKAILGVDINGSMESLNTLVDLSNGVYTQTLDQNDVREETNVVAGLYTGSDANNMNTVFQLTKTRYFNSKRTLDHQFVVAKVKSKTSPTKHVIYRIDKKTGVIDNEIELLDKTPNYFIDEVDNRVFINENNELVSCYSF